MARPEVFVSIDVETDGPVPGLNSMLALGAVAFAQDGSELDDWYSTLWPLAGARQDPDTMAWWAGQGPAWDEVTRDRKNPEIAIERFARWCEQLPGKPVAVVWPAAFDFAFINYYCRKYASRNPLGFACLDIRSYANGLASYRSYYGLPEQQVRAMAGEIDTRGLRPHVAVDDAREQGRLFMALRGYPDRRGGPGEGH